MMFGIITSIFDTSIRVELLFLLLFFQVYIYETLLTYSHNELM